jgi:D-glycero-alpha-D-manno-heptose-7-phosphate kinase
MIITQTPIRISFLGGGTDFRDFYTQEDGWVLSSAIDKYIFVVIKERFDDKIRAGYTKTELVDHIDELQHELMREALRKTGITKRVEIATMGDIPSAGSGLGSSSTVTVGLLNAMYTYLGIPKDPETLAQEACQIEIDVLGKPIGKQDQYIVAYGDMRFIRFRRDDVVQIESIVLEDEVRRRLDQNLMLFFTNRTRRSETILTEQVANINDRLSVLRKMKSLALEARECICGGALDDFGAILHQGWGLKKRLASKISDSEIDEIYETARKAGAIGGKITGAGGGGFLLLYCPREKQDHVRAALRNLPELPFHLERDGTKVIFNYRNYVRVLRWEEVVSQMASRRQTSVTGDRVFQELVKRLTHSLKVTISSLAMLDGQEGSLMVCASNPIRYLGSTPPVGRRIPVSDAPAHMQVIQEGKPVLFWQNESVPAIPPQELELTLTDKLKSGALLPVKVNGGVVGVVSLGEMRAWQRSPFTQGKLNQGLSLVARWAQTLSDSSRSR